MAVISRGSTAGRGRASDDRRRLPMLDCIVNSDRVVSRRGLIQQRRGGIREGGKEWLGEGDKTRNSLQYYSGWTGVVEKNVLGRLASERELVPWHG